MSSSRSEGPLLGNSVITSHLLELGYPQTSIDSMNKCGQSTKFRFIKTCACETKIIQAKHHCSLRTCKDCSKIRKRRISRRYLDYLSNIPQDRQNFLYFLTISPKNYSNMDEGLEHLKKSFSKFLRHNYIKERIKGGLYVIETKGGEGNWNIHLHAIIYGRFIDNKVRKEKDSKLVRLFKQSSNREVNIHVTKQDSIRYTLNYMLKYISSNKDDFNTPLDLAKYIVSTRKRRLIHPFGEFYKLKLKKKEHICKNCNHPIEYICDIEVIRTLEDRRYMEKPPPDLDYWFI